MKRYHEPVDERELRRTLDDEAVEEHAKLALDIMMATDDETFGPTNAVRALPDYSHLTAADRGAVNHRLTGLILG